MKTCQIATVGENIEWILKGLLIFNANKLILISTSNPEFLKKIIDIKNRLIDPEFEFKPLEIEEIIIESENPFEFIKILKKIILENGRKGFQIEVNSTAGLTIWQTLSYFIAIQLREFVRNYFIINKQKGDAFSLPLLILNKTEQTFLDLLGEKTLNIEDLKTEYENFKKKEVSVGLISKYLTKLKEKKLIQESKVERFKFFRLTELGRIYNLNVII